MDHIDVWVIVISRLTANKHSGGLLIYIVIFNYITWRDYWLTGIAVFHFIYRSLTIFRALLLMVFNYFLCTCACTAAVPKSLRSVKREMMIPSSQSIAHWLKQSMTPSWRQTTTENKPTRRSSHVTKIGATPEFRLVLDLVRFTKQVFPPTPNLSPASSESVVFVYFLLFVHLFIHNFINSSIYYYHARRVGCLDIMWRELISQCKDSVFCPPYCMRQN